MVVRADRFREAHRRANLGARKVVERKRNEDDSIPRPTGNLLRGPPLAASKRLHAAGAQLALSPSVVVAIKALACELPP